MLKIINESRFAQTWTCVYRFPQKIVNCRRFTKKMICIEPSRVLFWHSYYVTRRNIEKKTEQKCFRDSQRIVAFSLSNRPTSHDARNFSKFTVAEVIQAVGLNYYSLVKKKF